LSRCGLISILYSILMGLFGMAFFASESEQTTPLSVPIEATATTTAAPESHISTVNGVEIKIEDFRQRVMAERWLKGYEIRTLATIFGADQVLWQYDDDVNSLREFQLFGDQVLSDMELQILLEQEVHPRGLIIDDWQVDKQIQLYILGNRNSSQEISLFVASPDISPVSTLPTMAGFITIDVDSIFLTPVSGTFVTIEISGGIPTISPDALSTPEMRSTAIARETDFYLNLSQFNIPLEDVRQIFYFRALKAILQIEIGKSIPTQEVWVNSRHILIMPPDADINTIIDEACESEAWQPYLEQAEMVVERLNTGASFEVLAQELSDDIGSGVDGGALGWTPSQSFFIQSFRDTVETAPIGEIVGPVCSELGFHIIEVLGRELRDIPAEQLKQLQDKTYQEWEIELFSNATIQRRDNWQRYVPDTPTYNELLGDIFG
jgi:hypothetical protein